MHDIVDGIGPNNVEKQRPLIQVRNHVLVNSSLFSFFHSSFDSLSLFYFYFSCLAYLTKLQSSWLFLVEANHSTSSCLTRLVCVFRNFWRKLRTSFLLFLPSVKYFSIEFCSEVWKNSTSFTRRYVKINDKMTDTLVLQILTIWQNENLTSDDDLCWHDFLIFSKFNHIAQLMR